MGTEPDTQITPFTDDTLKELEENRRHAEEQKRYHSQEAEKWGELIIHLEGILGISQNGEIGTEKTGLSPTEFVVKLLENNPERWIPITEILFMSRSAFETGEVVNRTGTIENSIHSVLTRFRKNKKVWTKGKRESRKFKLKS